MATAAAAHKTALGRLLASIGSLITGLLNGVKKGFNSLPKDQQDAIISGVNISQVIKENYQKGEAAVVQLIATKVGISPELATEAILTIAKDTGVNVTSVQGYLDAIANKVQAGLTDLGWNALWETTAKFAATYLTKGSLDWVSLGLGVIEYAVQVYLKK